MFGGTYSLPQADKREVGKEKITQQASASSGNVQIYSLSKQSDEIQSEQSTARPLKQKGQKT